MKSFFRNALYMGLFAVVSVLVMDLMLANILFTVFHGIFGDDWYLLPYALSVLVVLSAVMIAGWRIHAARDGAGSWRGLSPQTSGLCIAFPRSGKGRCSAAYRS